MKKTTIEIIEINRRLADFMGSDIFKYRDSGMIDIKGNKILEGSIINANGYDSVPEEGYFHIVEFCDGAFGSDVYGDFDLLSSYQTIEVIGHVTDYIHRLDEKDEDEEFKFSNVNGALKGEATCLYHRSWGQLMPIVEKIEKDDNNSRWINRVFIQGNYCKVDFGGYPNRHEWTAGSTKIEATWLAVGKFVEWYFNADKNERV